jgi:aldehyde dehydrogenase (NAD+)
MDVTSLILRQRIFFRSGATRPMEFRRAQLRKLLDALAARESDLLAALHADLRKSAVDAYTTELGFVLGEIRHAIRHLPAWMADDRRRTPLLAWPARAFVRPEPFGVALIIGPWNYPLQLLLAPLVAAIAAGNCCVLKPSEFAPHTAQAIDELIRATFAPDFITVVQGDHELAGQLLLEKHDKIFFTGGGSTGRAVMAAAARHLTPVTLELGGKSPCIVAADAPLEIAARRIVWGKFMNAGQTCVAPDHAFVDRRVAPAFLEALRNAIHDFHGEDPRQSAAFGRIINRRHFDRIVGLLDCGRTVTGGSHDADDLYISPTVLTDVPPDAPVMREEIFGPVLPVVEFGDIGEVLAHLGDQPVPLALYLFTSERETQERVLSATRSGGVCINDTITHILGKDLPFGGLGESGMGAYHGRTGFDEFSHRRAVLRRSFFPDPAFRYPPSAVDLPVLKRILRWFGAG